MEKGAKALAYMLLAALVAGVVITFAHPAYRKTAWLTLKGEVRQSPIWQSNADYYPHLTQSQEKEVGDAE